MSESDGNGDVVELLTIEVVTRGPDGAHRTLVIQADPEGNGPGFPRIEGL